MELKNECDVLGLSWLLFHEIFQYTSSSAIYLSFRKLGTKGNVTYINSHCLVIFHETGLGA
jgi:hypothetical protein